MSRAYRIRVRESLRRVVRAADGVSTQLEILEILPPEQTAQLLGEELQRHGFELQGKLWQRRDDGVTVSVDAGTGTVAVRAEGQQDVQVEGKRDGYAYDDAGPGRQDEEKRLREALRQDLQAEVSRREAELQKRITDRLEGRLADLRKELDQAVNRVTAEALKRKAAQLGQIKELTEDPQSGSLTIVLEV